MSNDPLEIPEHIRKAAATVEIFFKLNGINEWALMGIRSRWSEPEPMEYCEDCNTPLSACGEQDVDGIPTMDCQVCKLMELLAAERAARAQAEKQRDELEKECKAWEESTRDAHNAMARAEMSEARLAQFFDAIKHWKTNYETELESCDKWEKWCNEQNPPDTHGLNFHGGKRSGLIGHDIALCHLKDLLTQTTPPPILDELERLREWFQNSYNVERCEFSPTDWKTLRDNALAERDALIAELEKKEEAIGEFSEILRMSRVGLEIGNEKIAALNADSDQLRAHNDILKAADYEALTGGADYAALKLKLEVASRALKVMLNSATPHPDENPTMAKAWKSAKEALSQLNESK